MKIIKILFFVLLLSLLLSANVFARQQVNKISGDEQIGIQGYPLKDDFVVQVLADDSKTAVGVPVVFAIVLKNEEMGKDTGIELSSPVSITDKDGYARTRLNIGSCVSKEILVTASTRETIGNPLIFSVFVQSKMWVFLLIIGIFGGLGVFLFGMFYLNESLGKISGRKLKDILIKLTSSPWKGLGTGFFVTMLNQTSSATTVLEVSLVSVGIMTFYQSIAVTMGAEIGSTITAQLVAFKISDYAVLMAGFGFFVSFFSKEKKWKNIGDAILGFGILFLGMKIMSEMMVPVAKYGILSEAFKYIENPFMGILAGLFFTVIMQSSGAVIGIVIAMALSGAITLGLAIPLTLGSQVGTCITAWISSFGRTKEAKKVAIWHIIHQIAGVVLIYPFLTFITYKSLPAWVYFTQWFTQVFFFTQDTARQIAMSHTLISVFNAAIFLPFIPLIDKILRIIYPSKIEKKVFGPQFIDKNLLSNPSLALEQSKKEIVRQGYIVLEMVNESQRVLQEKDIKSSYEVSLQDFKVDILCNRIVAYLSKIGQQNILTDEQSSRETELLYVTADIESIGDIIDKNIMPLVRKRIRGNLRFSDDGWDEINTLYAKINVNFENIIDAIDKNDLKMAKAVYNAKKTVNTYEAELREKHIKRIRSGHKESLKTSSIHLDLISHLKRINSCLADVGAVLIGER